MKELKRSQGCYNASWRKIAQGENLKTSLKKTTSKSLSDYKYKLASYIRLSPSDEIREEGSLVSHPQRIKNFVKMKTMTNPKWGKVIETYTDKDFSGKNMNRPAFQKMCRDIVSGKVNAVIVTELSRLSRSVKDFCQFWDFLKENKVKFFSLKENFDTSTAMGELMVIQAISFAQFERQTTVERIKHGVLARAERGLSNGGQRLLGYDPHPTKKCHLIVNEKEKPLVETIFKKFLELGSLSKTLNFLNEKGYTTKSFISKKGEKRGGTRWTGTSLHTVLTNLTYLGKRELNKKNRSKDPSELTPSERYKIYDAKWPALVNSDLFYDVQKLLEKNKRELRASNHCYVLSGLTYCGVCGDKLVGKGSNGNKGKKYFYYGHKRKMLAYGDRHLKKCDLEHVPAHTIEEAVMFRIRELSKNKDLLVELAQNNTSQNQKSLKTKESLFYSLLEELKRLRKDIEGLMKAIARSENTKAQGLLIEELEKETDKKQKLENEIQSLKKQKTQFRENVISAENIFSALNLINKTLPKLTPRQKKELLSRVIKKIVVYKEGLGVEYFGQDKMALESGVEVVKNPHNVRLGRDDWIRTSDPLHPMQVR